ncbi:MAG: type II secretion system protein GspD [Methylophilaceae bacterium]
MKLNRPTSLLISVWVGSLVVLSPAIADEVIPLGVEEGNIQVSKVIKTTPLGSSFVEYTKTKMNEIPKQSPDLKLQTKQTPVQANTLSHVAAPTLSISDQPLEKASQNEVAALDLLPPSQQQGIVVKTKDDAANAVERLKKIKAAKERLKHDDSLNLVTGEELVDIKRTAKTKASLGNKSELGAEKAIISRLEFNQANILDVTRALADISGLNFVATEKAAKKNVTVFLQSITVINALETITKNSGLWYRKDKKSGTYRIMSTDEYARDLIVYREDVTRVFKLLHPNPMLIATTVQDLYGRRVILSYGMFDDTVMQTLSSGTASSGVGRSNNTRGRSNRNNRGNSTVSRGGGTGNQNVQSVNETKADIANQVTASQLEGLEDVAEAVGNQDAIGTDKLGALATNEQPIYVTLNREQDLMIVRTSDVAVMKDIEALVKQLDLPTKQVLLEMKILSLDVGDFYRRITDLDFMPSSDTLQGPLTDQAKNPLGTIAPINVDTTTTVGGTTQTQSGVVNLGVSHILGLGNFALEGGTFVYQFLSDKIRARIQLLQQNNRINTLSSPILLTTNKKPARVFVGTEQVVTTGFEAVTGTTNGLVATNPAIVPITEIRDIGNTLQVMPNINGDKTVTLLIQQDASSLVRGGSTIPIPVGNTVQSFNVDSVRTSNIQGTVVAKDGLTIAIGGLIDATDSEDIQKVPVIGDFPIIGEFFKRKVKEKSKRELILLITPHIIDTPHESDDISRDVIEPLTESEW